MEQFFTSNWVWALIPLGIVAILLWKLWHAFEHWMWPNREDMMKRKQQNDLR